MIQASEEQIEEFYRFWGDDAGKIPNPVNYPHSFMHYWRMWEYCRLDRQQGKEVKKDGTEKPIDSQ